MQLRWRHVIINTHSSWLHGSPKGFRSRGHRIHSSGDYRTPPPPGEHAALLVYHQERSSPRVSIPAELRGIIGARLIGSIQKAGYDLLTVSVSDLHAHFVVDLPEELPEVKLIVGRAKESASKIANKHLEGFRWAAGGTFKFVTDPDHLSNAVEYVRKRQGPHAWSWCPGCGVPDTDPAYRCKCERQKRTSW